MQYAIPGMSICCIVIGQLDAVKFVIGHILNISDVHCEYFTWWYCVEASADDSSLSCLAIVNVAAYMLCTCTDSHLHTLFYNTSINQENVSLLVGITWLT